jgi:glutamate 5-kinase
MTNASRKQIFEQASTIVVKIGTHVLTDEAGRLSEAKIADLAGGVNHLLDAGHNVILVSSGAVGAGIGRMNLAARPTDLAQLQAVAAIGQSALVESYHRLFAGHGRCAAQVLLTADVLEERARYLNARNTLLSLLAFGAVPIINENDTVSVEELRASFGDNDQLAAIVSNLIHASLLVLLSNVDGLYNGDPASPDSKRISTVASFDDSLFDLACDSSSSLSKGGMASKLRAAKQAVRSGSHVIIADGRKPDVLDRLQQDDSFGTLFLAEETALAARKRWIGFAVKPRGSVRLDSGACRAVQNDGRSLLPIGISDVEGDFVMGDVIQLQDSQGTDIGRGLSNYSADDIRRIRGLHTSRILQVLGHSPYEEVVHRDNMILL